MVLNDAELGRLGWSLEPGVVVPLALSAVLYARGAFELRRRGRGRSLRRWEVASFGAGWLVVALALLSPLHEMSEQLFSAHMVQHELLMALAAPLLVLGRPMIVMLWAIPPRGRQVVARAAHGSFTGSRSGFGICPRCSRRRCTAIRFMRCNMLRFSEAR